MDINFRLEFLLLFLSLSLLAGRELAAQTMPVIMPAPEGRFYKPEGIKMSNDGSWLTVYKSYDFNSDTVLILNCRSAGQPVGYRTKVKDISFLENNNILIRTNNQAELFNPNEQTSIFYKGVVQTKAINCNSRFVLHYDEDGQNLLEMHDCDGRLINSVTNVRSFYTFGNDRVFTVTEDVKGRFNIVQMTNKSTEKVYSSSHNISVLESYPGVKGLIIYEQHQDSISQEVLFLGLPDKLVYPLNDLLPLRFMKADVEFTDKAGVCFLSIVVRREKDDNSIVDIWYGNDNKLEQKFWPSLDNLYFIWEPEKKRLLQLEKNKSVMVSNIGSDNHFLCFDPWLLNDYTKSTPLNIYVFNLNENRYSFFDTVTGEVFISPDGSYMINEEKKIWSIYNVESDSKEVIINGKLKLPYFIENEEDVIFEGDGGLWRYNTETKRLTQLNSFGAHLVSIVNSVSNLKLNGSRFFENTINLKEPLILNLYDTINRLSTYLLWRDSRVDTIISPTTRRIQFLTHDAGFKNFAYTEEDYNLPPRIVFRTIRKSSKIIFQSNKADTAILSLKQEIISFTSGDGLPLKGRLYYPLNYSSLRKYPMVVHIYGKQIQSANIYPYPTYYEDLGLNIRLLIERGYFVYMPDILIQSKNGPGMDALDCINNALDALKENILIDTNRIGLIGHSFGGYEVNFIATHSNRFAAFVSGSSKSDLIKAYYSFNYNFLAPDYKRIESGQYRMNVPFSADKKLYFENNPIYYAEQVKSPFLLWTGTEDENVTSDNSMAFYNALRRNKKLVIALFYKGEGHSLQNPVSQVDLTNRIIEWFDYFLQGSQDCEWIDVMINKEGVH